MKFAERDTKRNRLLFCPVTEQLERVWEKRLYSHNEEKKSGEAPM